MNEGKKDSDSRKIEDTLERIEKNMNKTVQFHTMSDLWVEGLFFKITNSLIRIYAISASAAALAAAVGVCVYGVKLLFVALDKIF